MPSFVIVGASLAGAKAAETLREEGFDGEIVLLGSEPERPYERPPLSKGYLLGNDERGSVFVHSADWYAENQVDLREGVTVTEIDRSAATVTVSGPAGTESLSYDKLLLANGASPRRLDFPGSESDEVLDLDRPVRRDRDRVRSGGHRVTVLRQTAAGQRRLTAPPRFSRLRIRRGAVPAHAHGLRPAARRLPARHPGRGRRGRLDRPGDHRRGSYDWL